MAYLDDLPGVKNCRIQRRSKPVIPTDTDGVPMVPYVRPKCPQCQSTECPVYDSNHLPIRYHKCKDCDFCFKSIEIDASNLSK